jgi:pimeloyl-ACP methyl ester carboxylesterase
MTAIIGELDPIHPAAERLHQINPESRLIVVPAASHQTAQGTPEFIAGTRERIASHPLAVNAD